MNNPLKAFGFFVLFFGLAVLASAQETGSNEAATPIAPFIAEVPEFFQWTIAVTDKSRRGNSPEEPKAASEMSSTPPGQEAPEERRIKPKKITCIRTKDIKVDVITFSNGKKAEIWYSKGMVMQTTSSGETLIDGAGGNNAATFVSDLSSAGFLDVGWITLGKFVEKQKLQNGLEVFLYRDRAFAVRSAMGQGVPEFARRPGKTAEPETENIEALVEVKSRLPLLVKRGSITLEYSYQPPPTEMLIIPPLFQAKLIEIDQREKSVQALRDLTRR